MAGKQQKRARMFILVRLSDWRPCQLGNLRGKWENRNKIYRDTDLKKNPKRQGKERNTPTN